MTIIEKIKAGHPILNFTTGSNVCVITNREKSIASKVEQGIITLQPQPKEGEVLTEEWARYYISIGNPLEWVSNDGNDTWGDNKPNVHECYNPRRLYRLTIPKPKVRNMAYYELPYCWVRKNAVNQYFAESKMDFSTEDGIQVPDVWIEERVRKNESWTEDGITFHPFTVKN